MSNAMPPLSALRAFEAAARHLSFTRAAAEMNVTPGALSHQIRGLEEFLGVRLFERRTRSVALTAHGRLLYPGLQSGFGLIRDAVAGLRAGGDDRVLVLSTSPGLTSKWLAARLYRFAEAFPDIDLRVSSSLGYANFATDGVDAAIRSASVHTAGDSALVYEKLLDGAQIAVCSPKLIDRFGPLDAPGILSQVPFIHDDSQAAYPEVPTWSDWLDATGFSGINLKRGLRFNHADHALDAALEGAGLLLTQNILAYDDLRNGRLLMPFDTVLPSGRTYHFVYPKSREKECKVRVLRDWIVEQAALIDMNVFRRKSRVGA